MKAAVRLVCWMAKPQFWWISNFWWKIFCLKIPKKLQLWPWSGCLPRSTLPGFMVLFPWFIVLLQAELLDEFWLSLWAGKQISGVGLSKLGWFNTNPCCGVGVCSHQVVSGHFEAAQGWGTSYLLWAQLLLYLFWWVVLKKYSQCHQLFN